MDWVRTGKITMRAGDYLIVRYPTHYLALYGPVAGRTAIGRYPTVGEAQKACYEQGQKEALG